LWTLATRASNKSYTTVNNTPDISNNYTRPNQKTKWHIDVYITVAMSDVLIS